MRELEQNLDSEWGYTLKGGVRPLTQDEHDQLIELRRKETEYLQGIIKHNQSIVNLARNKDPKITGEEIVVIVFHGVQATLDVFHDIAFDESITKFHFGAPFTHDPSWLVSISYGIDLEGKFPGKFHFADDPDIVTHVRKIVSPYGFDAANLRG